MPVGACAMADKVFQQAACQRKDLLTHASGKEAKRKVQQPFGLN